MEALPNILETERLALRVFTQADAPFIIQLLNTEGWLHFIGNKHVHTEEQAKAYLQQGPLKSYEENGYGLCLVQQKNNGSPIGMCGLLKRDFLDFPDIGFAFLPEFFGQGYAYEMALAVLQHAKDNLQIKNVQAVVMPSNHRSKRLLEKLGMTSKKNIIFPGETEELLLYEKQWHP